MAKRELTLGITVGERGRISLPASIVKQLNIGEGDVLVPELTDHGTIELVPMALIPRDQVWFAHPDMQARMAAAHEDIVAGRTETVTSDEELDAALARLKEAGRGD
jgi:antitoxin MazE